MKVTTRLSMLGSLVLLGGSACSSGVQEREFTAPEVLLGTSEGFYRHGDCGEAEQGFERLTLQLPSRDSLATRARFFLAECQFQEKLFLEAARNFRRVMEESPQSSLAPYALLRAGDAQSELWKRPELDPTYGDAALDTYRQLIARFPDSPAAQRAVVRLNTLSELFAEKAFKNGNFYKRLGATDSAILYFKNLVAEHPQTAYAGKALVKLVELYDKLGYAEEMQEICAHLGRFYPDEPEAGDRCEKISSASL